MTNLLQAIPPIHVTVQQAPTPLWTILAPLILSMVLAAATIYYAWRMHRLAAVEKMRRDKDDDFRAEVAAISLTKLRITLEMEQPILSQMRQVASWSDADLSRLISNASMLDHFDAIDLDLVMLSVENMKAAAGESIETGMVSPGAAEMFVHARTCLLVSGIIASRPISRPTR